MKSEAVILLMILFAATKAAKFPYYSSHEGKICAKKMYRSSVNQSWQLELMPNNSASPCLQLKVTESYLINLFWALEFMAMSIS